MTVWDGTAESAMRIVEGLPEERWEFNPMPKYVDEENDVIRTGEAELTVDGTKYKAGDDVPVAAPENETFQPVWGDVN